MASYTIKKNVAYKVPTFSLPFIFSWWWWRSLSWDQERHPKKELDEKKVHDSSIVADRVLSLNRQRLPIHLGVFCLNMANNTTSFASKKKAFKYIMARPEATSIKSYLFFITTYQIREPRLVSTLYPSATGFLHQAYNSLPLFVILVGFHSFVSTLDKIISH